MGLLFAEVFVAVVAKDTAATYEAFVGPSLENAGIQRREITAAIETGAARGIRALVVQYESLCHSDPSGYAHRVDCGKIHKLNAQRIPNEH